jgi:adenylate kinase
VYNEAELGESRVCADDGEPLVQRDDDQPEAVSRRIEVFEEQTAPVLEYYQHQDKVLAIDGQQTVDAIREEIIRRLKELMA